MWASGRTSYDSNAYQARSCRAGLHTPSKADALVRHSFACAAPLCALNQLRRGVCSSHTDFWTGMPLSPQASASCNATDTDKGQHICELLYIFLSPPSLLMWKRKGGGESVCRSVCRHALAHVRTRARGLRTWARACSTLAIIAHACLRHQTRRPALRLFNAFTLPGIGEVRR